MPGIKTAFLHYTAPPVVGGVEAVMQAHAGVFLNAGYPVTIIAGRGDESALPDGTRLVIVPEIDSQHERVKAISAELEQGRVPDDFYTLRDLLFSRLEPLLADVDALMVHNVFFKHFNLSLTAALFQILESRIVSGRPPQWWAWGHDFSWTSVSSRSKVFPGQPWDLLRRPHPGLCYVVVSEQRRMELVELFGANSPQIRVIYNGVDPRVWFGLSDAGWELALQLDMLDGDPVMVMPVRVTQAKNIEFAERVVRVLKDASYQPRLIITGPPDPHSPVSMEYFKGLLRLRSELGLDKEVRFVFDTGSPSHTITQTLAAEILRASDIMLMTSRREGFGMPVLEAGLAGIPVVCSDNVPAAQEIGREQIFRFSTQSTPEEVADLIRNEVLTLPSVSFRRAVRLQFTWERIFQQDIEPGLKRI